MQHFCFVSLRDTLKFSLQGHLGSRPQLFIPERFWAGRRSKELSTRMRFSSRVSRACTPKHHCLHSTCGPTPKLTLEYQSREALLLQLVAVFIPTGFSNNLTAVCGGAERRVLHRGLRPSPVRIVIFKWRWATRTFSQKPHHSLYRHFKRPFTIGKQR
jgi:hypothetical protein